MTNDELDQLANGHGSDARYARRVRKRRAAAAARGGGADFTGPLTEALDNLASRIDPGARKALAGEVATDLRDANVRRLKANVQAPDDAPMTPRKAQKGRKGLRSKRLRDPLTRQKRSEKSGRMFRRATGPRYLRKESTTGEASVGFVGAMGRIMSVHQYGEVDTVTRDPNSPKVQYPARVVLGMDHNDRARILGQMEAAIGG